MAATYVNNLRVAEPADGDADWGTTTNTSLEAHRRSIRHWI